MNSWWKSGQRPLASMYGSMLGNGFGIANSFCCAILHGGGHNAQLARRSGFIISRVPAYKAVVRHLFFAKSALLACALFLCAPALAAQPPEFDHDIKPVF